MTLVPEHVAEARSLLTSALPRAERKDARHLTLPKLVEAALDNIVAQVQEENSNARASKRTR